MARVGIGRDGGPDIYHHVRVIRVGRVVERGAAGDYAKVSRRLWIGLGWAVIFMAKDRARSRVSQWRYAGKRRARCAEAPKHGLMRKHLSALSEPPLRRAASC